MNPHAAAPEPDPLKEGTRIGRYVLLRDNSGTLHAVSAGSVSALCETDDGTVLLLPGGRVIMVRQSLRIILTWFELRG